MSNVIFMNGVYGVGKTTVANMVQKITCGKIECIDPDIEFNKYIERCPKLILAGFPINRNKWFIYKFRGEIEELPYDKTVIIPMNISNKVCKEELLDYVSEKCNIVHVILTADDTVTEDRILNDKERMEQFSLDNICICDKFLKDKYMDAIRIDTSSKSPEYIARKVIGLIGSKIKL